MAEKFSKESRSQIMRQVKSSGNKSTELRIIRFFKVNNIKGWRRNYPLLGKPDFVFLAFKIVVFVDGCFWHGHECKKTQPINNEAYWHNKIERNKQRDMEVSKALVIKGWEVIRIWECDLKNEAYLLKIFQSLIAL